MAKTKTKAQPLLNPVKFGLAAGIFFGVVLLITTLISASNGYGTALLNIFVSIYPGYAITYGGAVLALIYGFIDGFIGLYILIWLYNWLSK